MYSTDPIADMLTRIRNALMRHRYQVVIPYSQIKHKIALIFLKYKFIDQLNIEGKAKDKVLVLNLLAEGRASSPISELKRLSTPGRRVYVNWQNIPIIRNGRGLVILSTDQGIITGFEARQKKTRRRSNLFNLLKI